MMQLQPAMSSCACRCRLQRTLQAMPQQNQFSFEFSASKLQHVKHRAAHWLHLSCPPPRCSVPGCTWLPTRKEWQLPMRQQDACVRALETAPGVRVEVQPLHPIPQAALQVSTRHRVVQTCSGRPSGQHPPQATWAWPTSTRLCSIARVAASRPQEGTGDWGMHAQQVRSTEPTMLRTAHTRGACQAVCAACIESALPLSKAQGCLW